MYTKVKNFIFVTAAFLTLATPIFGVTGTQVTAAEEIEPTVEVQEIVKRMSLRPTTSAANLRTAPTGGTVITVLPSGTVLWYIRTISTLDGLVAEVRLPNGLSGFIPRSALGL